MLNYQRVSGQDVENHHPLHVDTLHSLHATARICSINSTRMHNRIIMGSYLKDCHRTYSHQNHPTPSQVERFICSSNHYLCAYVLETFWSQCTWFHLSCAQGETLSSSPIAMVFNVDHPQYHQKWLIRGNPPQLELDVVGFTTITMTLWHYDILFPGNIPCIMTIYYNSFYMHNT